MLDLKQYSAMVVVTVHMFDLTEATFLLNITSGIIEII
jgi:hypothetical protein